MVGWHWRCPRLLSSVSETPGSSFAGLVDLGNRGWRGALRIVHSQAPLRGEGLGEGGGGLPAEAGVGAFGKPGAVQLLTFEYPLVDLLAAILLPRHQCRNPSI
jgi:hypothetical protein